MTQNICSDLRSKFVLFVIILSIDLDSILISMKQEFNCYYNNLRENLEKSMKYCNHTNEDCNQLIRNYY